MSEALREAQKALEKNEVPVGAIIVHEGKIIGRAHNQIRLLKDPTAHAEMIAITQAASYLGNERLINTTAYVTIEPCAMCSGALVLGRVKRLVYGSDDIKAGGAGSVLNICSHAALNHRLQITRGVMAEECRDMTRSFFLAKRKEQKVR